MVEAIPELCVHFEKAREKARATKAAAIAKLPESKGGPSWTRTRSQWLKNAATYFKEAAFLSTSRHLDGA
jgi:hypothetical protein